ncbi:MAG: hypothetical protein F6K42_02410 [Leptolyngbya sp. SIO1D8]|nr:hypothetical protein [Leptolyngbya sp. SIO1D8]
MRLGWRQSIWSKGVTSITLVSAWATILASSGSSIEPFKSQSFREIQYHPILSSITWQHHSPHSSVVLEKASTALANEEEAELPEAPSPWWLIVMPAIPLLGGGFIYAKRRLFKAEADRLLPTSPPDSPSTLPKESDPKSADLELPSTQSSETTSLDAQETGHSLTSSMAAPSSRNPITTAIVDYFPLIGITSVTLSAFVTYVVVRSQLIQPVVQDLEQVADAQTTELDTWFRQQRQALLNTNTLPEILPEVEKLLVPHEHKTEHEMLQQLFHQYIHSLSPFRNTEVDIALLTNGGIVTYATDSRREGQYQPLQNTTTYITRDTTDTLPNLYVSPLTDELQITFATPILAAEGQRLGVLAVDLDLTQLSQRIKQFPPIKTVSTLETADSREIYLVGRASLVKNQIVSADQDLRAKYRDGVESYGIQQATSRINGSGLYLNYAKVPVIGVYRWASRHNLALLVEVEQAEIFKPAQRLARQILGIGFTSVGILTLLLARYPRNIQNTDDITAQDLPVSERPDSNTPPWSPGARE